MVEIAAYLVFAMLSVALVLALIRLMKGPMLPNRVVALELIASLLVGFIAVYAIHTGVDDFIDVAIVLALLAFMAAVGFARYLEKGGPRDD
ncbi:monovalent cation/H+ antiporter complex subunit F [Halorhodospira halochloris]|uniref:Na(+) H(+) antiporter subunit F n=1 Tax=Halorhodospira halochloris TaxID=1052 RepID=A0A120N014_HALHR|nr:monovalent cation/H+ antiporter complex subunit F [Halorhodospira halochloris]MBK1652130.1 pH regulation protein F [Halorhodospira halochloris]MCG5530558.1 monovalent cation/H+ antiporter complex subunit F [Halorhodospira halochloris]MCG5547860.1 monovalent cation/H+ antiporter complex subunit F [Halorhodospira halochloris]BAU58452.1 Na(+) H(+) antiporter subunit F [Halorhodospira halochloris]